MGSMSSLRWTQSCQLLENPLSSGTLSNLSVGTSNVNVQAEHHVTLGIDGGAWLGQAYPRPPP